MVTVWLILLVVLVTLTGLLWGGTLFLQGYYYTEPTRGIAWQAPAAASALTLFFALWCIIVVNSGGVPSDIPYNTLFSFSAEEDLFPKPVKELYAVLKEGGGKDRYVRETNRRGIIVYKDTTTAHRPWPRAGVSAVYIKYKNQAYLFQKQETREEGRYQEYLHQDGWRMIETEDGITGVATRFRFGRLFTNLFLNFFHLSLWFICLWLLLRFQWGHALGLAVVMWLIMTLAILPMLLEQAARVNLAQAA